MARLQEQYNKEIVAALKAKLGRDNLMSIPKLKKIVLNMGVGKALQDKNRMEQAAEQLAMIAGQRPQVTKAMWPWPVFGFARATRSAAGSRSAASGCMNSWIGSSTWPCLESATFAG